MPAADQHPIYQNPEVPLDRGVAVTMLNGWVDNTCDVIISTGPSDGLNNYTVTVFGLGMLYGSIGANGSLLVDQIASSCQANITAPYSFSWYQANGTMIMTNLSTIVQPDSEQLPSTLSDNTTGLSSLLRVDFGLKLTMTLNSTTFTSFCIGQVLILAGGATMSNCDGPPFVVVPSPPTDLNNSAFKS